MPKTIPPSPMTCSSCSCPLGDPAKVQPHTVDGVTQCPVCATNSQARGLGLGASAVKCISLSCEWTTLSLFGAPNSRRSCARCGSFALPIRKWV